LPPVRRRRPVITCFPDLESKNINNLVLISCCLARVTREGVSRRAAPAIRGGGPRGIPNPKRRLPDLGARPLSAQALSDLPAPRTVDVPATESCRAKGADHRIEFLREPMLNAIC
jgi:hypothetical protein